MHLVLLRRYVLETVETRSLLLHQSIWYTLESRRTIVSEGMVKSVFACRKDLESFSSIWGGSTRKMKCMYTCICVCVCSHVFIYVFISIYVFVCVCAVEGKVGDKECVYVHVYPYFCNIYKHFYPLLCPHTIFVSHIISHLSLLPVSPPFLLYIKLKSFCFKLTAETYALHRNALEHMHAYTSRYTPWMQKHW